MSLIRGEFFPSIATKVMVYYEQLYCDPLSITDGDIVYCDTHQINHFQSLLKTKKDLTIITHNSDGYVCDCEPWKQHGVNTNNFDGCYKKWYAQNSYSTKHNVIPIPIGFENTRWENNFGPKTQWINEVALENIFPIAMIYFNCRESTNKTERQSCKETCSKFDFVNVDTPNLSYKDYLRNIKSHKFTLSPEGNGLDCHRTWEILAMGRIPIIKRSGALEQLYKNLPVLFINKWEELADVNLEYEYQQKINFNNDILNFEYWKNKCLT